MTNFENELTFGETKFYYLDLKKVFEQYPKLKKLPNVLKILLEMNLRNTDPSNFESIIEIFSNRDYNSLIEFTPSRILMDDEKGILALIELANIVEYLEKSDTYTDISLIPKVICDLIIDHSFISQSTATHHSSNTNLQSQIQTNTERYDFLKWANEKFHNLNIVSPGYGIGHQINLEFLATMISVEIHENKQYLIPEAILGTDIHTSMINSLGIASLSAEEIDILSVMLGSTVNINLPKVLGIGIIGKKDEYINASDIVLSLTQFIKDKELDFDYVEFYGESIESISVEDRASIANMANEYGAKCAYFSVDKQSIKYAQKTRNVDASLIKYYYEQQGLFYKSETQIEYDEFIEFDLSLIKSSIAGPRNVHKKVNLEKVASKLESFKRGNTLRDNDIVLASITSCLATSNPFLVIQAALLAKNAVGKNLNVNPNIKTSFTPGSITVKKYLEQLGLLEYLEKLGFTINGFGCGVCAGNSGNLFPNVESEIKQYNLNVSSVSSGNNNKEGFIHSLIKSNWLMSPALVIAYSLKGSVNLNIKTDILSKGIYLNDIWPSDDEVNSYVEKIKFEDFSRKYSNIFLGDSHWQEIELHNNENSILMNTYNHYEDKYLTKVNFNNTKILAVFNDDVCSESIMPRGKILKDSFLGEYLRSLNIHEDNLATYEYRSSNFEFIQRALFSGINLKNNMVKKNGPFTHDFKNDETILIYDYAKRLKNFYIPTVIFAGKNFGFNHKDDTSAKAMKLLGINVIICESMDNLFRESLINNGILPLQLENDAIESMDLVGNENVYIYSHNILPEERFNIEITENNKIRKILVKSLLQTNNDVIYFKNAGKIPYFIKSLL